MSYVRQLALLGLCWLGGLLTGFAQTNWPAAYEIKTDSAVFQLDPAQYQLLADPQGSFTFGEVQRSTAFRHEARYNPARTAHVYWIRMRLKNARPRPAKLYLYDVNSNYLDAYWRDSTGRWQHQRTGDLVPESLLPSRNGNKERNRLFLEIPAGQETVIYQRSETIFWRPPLTYITVLFQTEEGRIQGVFDEIRVKNAWQGYWFDGIALGILLLAVCYNLLIYISAREKVYLYFGICLLFFVLDRNTSRLQLVFFSEQPYAFKLVANAFFILYFFFFVQSIRRLMQSSVNLPRLDRATMVMLAVTALLNLLQILSYQYPALPMNEVYLACETAIRVVYALCLVMSYQMMRQRVADARYVFIAILPLFVWWSFSLVDSFYGIYAQASLLRKIPDIFVYAESVCFSWMIIFFSGVLISRYNLTRRQVVQQAIEKEQLEKEREMERSRIIASQNERLEQQVKERTAELRQSLETLRATQNQLIQKEKLASLGELTAGIAHEIQNPLNFVNNFAEVSLELVDELREERGKPQPDEALADEILTDLTQNLEKINQHGRRAGAIVQGMLEHSRASTGEKQPTDLNALADEYLRLAYHGLRAKDKRFNCALITNFDPNLPRVTVVAQDMGRVLLNLYTNAFYAVQQQSLAVTASAPDSATPYQPAVWVSTRVVVADSSGNGASVADQIEIRVRDNGTGIADAVRQKIFQPFFTTRPTGQGTGLGLSLSYDIVTKGHGGELTVESREGSGTEFSVRLPTT